MNVRNFFLIAIAFYLGGCGASPYYLEPDATGIPAGKSAVFGELSVGVANRASYYVTVIDTTNSTVVLNHHLDELHGPFCWLLPPGRYAILDIHFTKVAPVLTKWSSKRIYAEFSIDSPSQLIYIGNLHVDWSGKGVKVEDEYDKAVRTLHANYPNLQGVPIKSLSELEEKL